MQDGISSVAGRVKRNRFRYSKPLSWLRYGMLALFIVSLVAGGGLVIGGLARLIAPYSAFGRIAQNLFVPIWQAGNNLAAWVAERAGSYAFYETEVWIKSAATFGVALATFAVIAVLAWRNGRTWCNTVCPVGTVLGFLSRYSLFRPVIDTEKCIDCGLCARRCKASCIDAKNHAIDYSRCVACFDCLENCSKHAISYTARRKSAKHAEPVVKPAEPAAAESADGKGISRRKFLSLAAVFAATAAVKAQEKKVDGGLAVIADKKIPKRSDRITPAGSLSARNMADHCTGCQLCVSVCPNGRSASVRQSRDADAARNVV